MAKIAVKVNARSPEALKTKADKIKKNMPLAIKVAAINLRNRLRIEIRAHAKDPTGALENSWAATTKSPLVYSVATDSPYARIRDKGGVIKARRSRFLAIPLRAGLRGKSPRDFAGFGRFVRFGQKRFFGRFIDGRFHAMFVLKRSVYQEGWDYVAKSRVRWLQQLSRKGALGLIESSHTETT